MKGKRYARAVCLLLAVALKAAQWVCFPLLPDFPLTGARLAGEGVFLLLALGLGLGMIACGLDLPGRAFWSLYGRCAGLCLLCQWAGLLLWQSLGSHWVVIHYMSEVVMLLVCSWQIRSTVSCGETDRRRRWRWALLAVVLLAVVGVQVFIYQSCYRFMVNSPSYHGALQGLALPMMAVEGVVLLAGCWLLSPTFVDRWQTRRIGAALLLILCGLLSGLGLFDWLVKPEGFLKGWSHSAAIVRQSLDWSVELAWHSETANWHTTRRRGGSTEDGESQRTLRLWDHQGRLAGWTMLTEPLTEETLLLDGQPVQLLYPYGLLLPADDTLRLVRLAELSRQPEDPLLTAVCKAYLKDFRLFGVCAGYLAQHDFTFVQPYLERYAAAAFTPEESAAMGDLRPAYVMCQAQQLLLRNRKEPTEITPGGNDNDKSMAQ